MFSERKSFQSAGENTFRTLWVYRIVAEGERLLRWLWSRMWWWGEGSGDPDPVSSPTPPRHLMQNPPIIDFQTRLTGRDDDDLSTPSFWQSSCIITSRVHPKAFLSRNREVASYQIDDCDVHLKMMMSMEIIIIWSSYSCSPFSSWPHHLGSSKLIVALYLDFPYFPPSWSCCYRRTRWLCLCFPRTIQTARSCCLCLTIFHNHNNDQSSELLMFPKNKCVEIEGDLPPHVVVRSRFKKWREFSVMIGSIHRRKESKRIPTIIMESKGKNVMIGCVLWTELDKIIWGWKEQLSWSPSLMKRHNGCRSRKEKKILMSMMTEKKKRHEMEGRNDQRRVPLQVTCVCLYDLWDVGLNSKSCLKKQNFLRHHHQFQFQETPSSSFPFTVCSHRLCVSGSGMRRSWSQTPTGNGFIRRERKRSWKWSLHKTWRRRRLYERIK